MRKRHFLFFILSLAFIGCLPSTRVVKNPGPNDKGIRYYRPKPYLLIQPAALTTTTKKSDGSSSVAVDGQESDRFVQISMQYMPDFSEEYSIRVYTGLGTNTTNITLQDGWNLTQLNQQLDSKFADNVKAIGELVGAIAPKGLVPTAGDDSGNGSAGTFVVKATNVPIGYYESIISRDQCGVKRLYGWRYVGFAPFNQCPLEGYGADCMECHSNILYGLVFRSGVMTFVDLGSISTSSDNTMLIVAKPPATETPDPYVDVKKKIFGFIGKNLGVKDENAIDVSVDNTGRYTITIHHDNSHPQELKTWIQNPANELNLKSSLGSGADEPVVRLLPNVP